MLTVLEERSHRARKQHRCDGCLRVIRVDTTYRVWPHVDDGRAYSMKLHPSCAERIMDYLREYSETEWYVGCVAEWDEEDSSMRDGPDVGR